MEKLLVFLIIAAAASSASALRCYVCNSHNSTECTDIAPGSKSRHLSDCDEIKDDRTYTLCRKIDMYLDMDFGANHPSEVRVHRACGWIEDEEKRDCYYKSGYNTRSWVCTCNTDDCNAAGPVSPFALVAIMALVCSLVAQAKCTSSV